MKGKKSAPCLPSGISSSLFTSMRVHNADSNFSLDADLFSPAIPRLKHPSRRTVPCRGLNSVGRNAANYNRSLTLVVKRSITSAPPLFLFF
jgi:hypothetical protein